jgi:cytidylate kinase
VHYLIGVNIFTRSPKALSLAISTPVHYDINTRSTKQGLCKAYILRIKHMISVIAIAGLPGSGKSVLTKALQALPQFSNWDVKSTGGLLRERHAFLVKNKNYGHDFIHYLNNLSEEEIIILNNEVRNLAIKGNLILDSRFSAENCKGINHALVIFLKASLDIRIDRQKKSSPHKSIEEIRNDLEKREQWEFDTGKRLYNYDYREAKLYKLILDTTTMNVDEEVSAIVKAVNSTYLKNSIAISGLPGSGSTTVAKLLSQKLNVSYFSAGQLWKDIAQGQAEHQHYYPLFKRILDKSGLTIPIFPASSKGSAAVNLWKTDLGKDPRFHQVIETLQQELIDRGSIIIDGKLSIRMTKNADFKIWLSGSLDARASRTAQRDHISVDEARKLLTERENIHRKEWLRIYGFDYLTQQKEADIVIDTSNKSPEQIVNEVQNSLSSRAS